MRMTASWSGSAADPPNTSVWRDGPRPMASSPRITTQTLHATQCAPQTADLILRVSCLTDAVRRPNHQLLTPYPLLFRYVTETATHQTGHHRAVCYGGFLRDEEIYSDDRGLSRYWLGSRRGRQPAGFDRLPVHRSESPTGYSSVGCSPAEPASASPGIDNHSSIRSGEGKNRLTRKAPYKPAPAKAGEPAFLRALDDEQLGFVADVPRTQAVWEQRPEIAVPPRRRGQGRPATKPQAASRAVTVEQLARSFRAEDWTRLVLRDSTRGPLRVDIACRRVWVWDGAEAEPRCWHLIVRREVGSPKTIIYTVSNAPAETPVLRLAQMQGQRYWVERVFEDAKSECGLADYQALGWRAWHHHVTMVLLAMLFIAEQRAAHHDEIDLLTSRDIVEILAEILPRKPEGHEALVRRINQRHERRRGAIRSRYRDHHRSIAT
jgi:DDE superfamily endonuclease